MKKLALFLFIVAAINVCSKSSFADIEVNIDRNTHKGFAQFDSYKDQDRAFTAAYNACKEFRKDYGVTFNHKKLSFSFQCVTQAHLEKQLINDCEKNCKE